MGGRDEANWKKALQALTRPKPADFTPSNQNTSKDLIDAVGPNIADALKKRPWMVSELLRIREEDLQAGRGKETNGGSENHMDVDGAS